MPRARLRPAREISGAAPSSAVTRMARVIALLDQVAPESALVARPDINPGPVPGEVASCHG